jgi:hypothetical protein
MIFKQYEDGSCDIIFSWKERLILLKKGKLHLSDTALKNFGNNLAKIVFEFQNKFNEKTSNMFSNENNGIKGE